jgi:hypothetical protein
MIAMKLTHSLIRFSTLAGLCLYGFAALSQIQPTAGGGTIDTLVLGDSVSEQAHGLTQTNSEVIHAGLGEPARQLLPLHPISHNGGSITFTLRVDPLQQNYFTVKLWGSDCGADRGRLILYLNGDQVGYRHEGDHDVLNQCDEEPMFLGRFVYQTVALPPMHTRGRTNVTLRIAALGPMWAYGNTFEKKQKLFTRPSRGIYCAFTHTNTRFEPPATEKQGDALAPKTRPAGPGEEILAEMKATVNSRLKQLMSDRKPITSNSKSAHGQILLLAEAYNTSWTVAHHNTEAIAALVRWGDVFLRPGVIGAEWIGAGPLGEAIMRVGVEPLRAALDEEIEVPANFPFVPDWRRREPLEEPAIKEASAVSKTKRLKRREAWTVILRASVDWNRKNGRRFYTNQSMIVDQNIYTANRALQLIAPSEALPEQQALRYLYEAVGLSPWLGNDTDDGKSSQPYGTNYFQITRKGLSRELGWVGTYGETILKFNRDMAELTGDAKLRQQLERIARARMYFRYPTVDPEGFRQMKLASEIDNRTAHFPLSQGAYAIANIREAWWMELPALLQDDVTVGAAQQCLADNQYFPRLAARAKDNDTLGMLRNIDEYAVVKALPASRYRLPMSDGQPDFVFSDEENAVLALKHGERRLFVNFYFRQEFGVSGVTRILDLTPTTMRIASVLSQFKVDASGEQWTRPDIIDFERSGGLPPPGEKLHQAWRGEKLPIAKRPADATRPEYGKWGPYVGKAAFYSLRYGDYLIAINTTSDRTFELTPPAGQSSARDLVSGSKFDLREKLKVMPLTTVVLDLGDL